MLYANPITTYGRKPKYPWFTKVAFTLREFYNNKKIKTPPYKYYFTTLNSMKAITLIPNVKLCEERVTNVLNAAKHFLVVSSPRLQFMFTNETLHLLR